MVVCFFFFFFFKQKTAYEMRISDWSSDVCSSDLTPETRRQRLSCALSLKGPDQDDDRLRSGVQLDGVVLDHRVGEQLLAHGLDLGARLRWIALGELELDDLALAHVIHAGEAEGGQRRWEEPPSEIQSLMGNS